MGWGTLDNRQKSLVHMTPQIVNIVWTFANQGKTGKKTVLGKCMVIFPTIADKLKSARVR